MHRYVGVHGYRYYDTDFLKSEVWPNIQSIVYCHDSYSCHKFPASHPFPTRREGAEHLGQVYDEFSIGRAPDERMVRKHPVNVKCTPQ